MRAITDVWEQPKRSLRVVSINFDDVLHALATGATDIRRVELRPPSAEQLAVADSLGYSRHATIAAGRAKFDPEKEPKKVPYFDFMSQGQFRKIEETAGIEAANKYGKALAEEVIPRLGLRAQHYLKFYMSARWLNSAFRKFLSDIRKRPGGFVNYARRLRDHLVDPRAILVFDRSLLLPGHQRLRVIELCGKAIASESARAPLKEFCIYAIAKLPQNRGGKPLMHTLTHALFLDFCDVAYSDDAIEEAFTDGATLAAKVYFDKPKFNPKRANQFRKDFPPRDLWFEY